MYIQDEEETEDISDSFDDWMCRWKMDQFQLFTTILKRMKLSEIHSYNICVAPKPYFNV